MCSGRMGTTTQQTNKQTRIFKTKNKKKEKTDKQLTEVQNNRNSTAKQSERKTTTFLLRKTKKIKGEGKERKKERKIYFRLLI